MEGQRAFLPGEVSRGTAKRKGVSEGARDAREVSRGHSRLARPRQLKDRTLPESGAVYGFVEPTPTAEYLAQRGPRAGRAGEACRADPGAEWVLGIQNLDTRRVNQPHGGYSG